MRKLLIVGAFILAACDGPGMDVFVGHTEQTLRDNLGTPTTVVNVPDGTRILSYRLSRQYAALPSNGSQDGLGFSEPYCSTTFVIREGVVASLSQFGNACPAQG